MNSCLIQVERNPIRALVDTGADVSVMHKRIYDSLKEKPQLKTTYTKLSGAKGNSISSYGVASVKFAIAGLHFCHDFHIVPTICRNVILGLDWLRDNKAQLDFDNLHLKIGKTKVNLEEDEDIASVIRLCKTVNIPPQTMIICEGRLKSSSYFPVDKIYHLFTDEQGSLSDEAGLILPSSIAYLDKNMKTMVSLVNNTNKAYTLKQGCIIGRLAQVKPHEILPIQNKGGPVKGNSKVNLDEAQIPNQLRSPVIKLLEQNEDIFAKNDFDLGQTDAVRMTIDTGNHPPDSRATIPDSSGE